MTIADIADRTFPGAPYPGEQWERATGHGWSAELLTRARAYSERAGSTAVMIVQHGRVVAEWGDPAHKSPVASVRKSLLSALYGIAIEEGKIRLDATLAELLGIDDKQPLTAAEKQATVADLLTTRSGVYHPVDIEPAGVAGARPPRGSHPHGTHFYYNNWDFNVLGTIYEQQSGEAIYDSFKRRIADAIGLQDFRLSDGAWGPGKISNHRNYGFKMSARDLARFGLLYLNRGRWRDRQIVPAPWVDESTRTYTTVRSQTFAGRGYGYMWWTGFGSDFSPTVTLPEGSYHALGIGAQYVFVIPAHDIVIVHTVNMAREKWPWIDDFQVGRLLWLILSAAGIAGLGPDTSPAARKSVLKGDALRAALAGKTLRFADVAADGPYFIRLDADGRASLTKGPQRRPTFTGKWWVEDEKLCRGWDKDLPRYDSFPVGIDGPTVSLYQDHDTMFLQAATEPEMNRMPEDTHFGYRQVPLGDKQALVDDVFHSVAGRYDLMNDLMSAGLHRAWKDVLVTAVNPPPKGRPGRLDAKSGDRPFALLDVAGGTGDIAFRVVDAGNHATRVTVADINHAMLEVGRARAIERGLDELVTFVEGNAEALPFPDRAFDAVTIAFGIRNVPRIELALKEAHRVLKLGGHFLCLEFSAVDVPGLDALYDAYSFNVIPAIGRAVTGDAEAYRYLVESIRRFPRPEAFGGMMRTAGFGRVSFERMSGGIVALHSGWRL